ncbi:hypothetical protein L1887_11813 [Cichorium endivia]|nr:hypothetical protein L1887_11813 [Cichorium endivia]
MSKRKRGRSQSRVRVGEKETRKYDGYGSDYIRSACKVEKWELDALRCGVLRVDIANCSYCVGPLRHSSISQLPFSPFSLLNKKLSHEEIHR